MLPCNVDVYLSLATRVKLYPSYSSIFHRETRYIQQQSGCYSYRTSDQILIDKYWQVVVPAPRLINVTSQGGTN